MSVFKSAQENTFARSFNVPETFGKDENTEFRSYFSSPLKRGMDLVISLLGLMILAVVFIPISIAILMSSRGSLFFRQTRLGLDGRSFTLLKFRTMRNPTNGESWASRTKYDDPRVTLVGSLLRKLYLDEFPQFWNVLRGEMNIVGPRPETPALTESIIFKHPRFMRRLVVKPGITGPAQIFYRHAENEQDAWRRYYYDAYYMRKCSFPLDLFIILRTVFRVTRYRGQ